MALLLYLVGLFGDSYYVVVEKLPLLKAFYDRLFELFDYTRNGLFFAPVFLMLGGFIADERRKLSSVEAGVGFLISLFRLDNFRRTQRRDYPAICHLIDRIWSISHLTFIFDIDEGPDWEENAEQTSAYC